MLRPLKRSLIRTWFCWQVVLVDATSVLKVHPAIGAPAALLRLDAGSIELQVW